jgi:hypothetical protein
LAAIRSYRLVRSTVFSLWCLPPVAHAFCQRAWDLLRTLHRVERVESPDWTAFLIVHLESAQASALKSFAAGCWRGLL